MRRVPSVSAFPLSERGERRQCAKLKGWKTVRGLLGATGNGGTARPTAQSNSPRTGHRIAHSSCSSILATYLRPIYRLDTDTYMRSGSQLVKWTTLMVNSFSLRPKFTSMFTMISSCQVEMTQYYADHFCLFARFPHLCVLLSHPSTPAHAFLCLSAPMYQIR